MNKEERFRKKATKVVMIVLALGFVVLSASAFYYFSVFSKSDPISALKAVQRSEQVRDELAEMVRSALAISAFVAMELLIVVLTLAATKIPLILRWISTPVVWLMVIIIRPFGLFENSRSSRRIKIPYGPVISGLLKFSRYVFSEKTFEGVFLPTIGDLNDEFLKAEHEGDYSKQRWLKFKYACYILSAMVEASPIGELIEFIRKIAG